MQKLFGLLAVALGLVLSNIFGFWVSDASAWEPYDSVNLGESLPIYNDTVSFGDSYPLYTDTVSFGESYPIYTDNVSFGESYPIVSYPAPQPAAYNPPPQCTESRREYPQCGGTVGLGGYRTSDTIIVAEITNSCSGVRYEVVSNLGNLGQCAQVPPQPPVYQPPVYNPPSYAPITNQVPINIPINNQPQANSAAYAQNTNLIDLDQRQNQAQDQDQLAIANARAVTGPITINSGGSTPVVYPAQNPVNVSYPVSYSVALPAAPAGTVVQPVYPSAYQVTYGTDAPTTIGTTPITTKELPKTGLPLLAWGLPSLIPIGWKLRRFGREGQKSEGLQLWQEREFSR